jgi:hypothetical protein
MLTTIRLRRSRRFTGLTTGICTKGTRSLGGYQRIIRRLRRRAPARGNYLAADGSHCHQDVAAVLQGRSDIGDGDLHRVIRDVQRRQWDPSRCRI